MPDQGRLKDRLKNKFNHLVHSLVPGRSRLPSPSPSTKDQQTHSTPVGPDPTSISGIPVKEPLNSPSLSNIYPSIVINPAEDEAPGMADSAGFQGVKRILELVESVADSFPPLKSTVAGLLGVIDIMEVRDFQLIVVVVMMLTVTRQPPRIRKITEIWSRS